MKKIVIIITLLLSSIALIGCSSKEDINDKNLVIGASIVPHAEILEFIRPSLEALGYTLEIIEFTDYVLPNLALENQELDANFFQHVPYLSYFNEENNTSIVNAGVVHFEPLGIYYGNSSNLSNITLGSTIAIPNDSTNRARALLLLASEGIISLTEGIGLNATVLDIVSNPYEIDFIEIEAASIPATLVDVDFAVINGNYALSSNILDHLLVSESKDSEAAILYANIIAVRSGDETNPAILALLSTLQSEEVREFITTNYSGIVLPVF